MTTLEAVHIDTTSDTTTVQMTLAYVRSSGSHDEETYVEIDKRIDVTWRTDRRGLYDLHQMVNGAPGVTVPAVRVAGSIVSDDSKALLAAVRARPVIDWVDGRPTVATLQVEFVGGDPSDKDLIDGYATLGLILDTTAWTTVRDAVGTAYAALLST